jgi:hypothetical protein
MKTGLVILASMVALAACGSSQQPQRGVGFNDYADFELERARREAALSSPRGTIVPPPRVNTIPGRSSPETPSQTQPAGAIPGSDLAAAGIGQTATQTPVNTGADPTRTQGLDASPTNAAPQLATNPSGISDEQSFDAVSGRETIESDAQRRAAQAAARVEVAPSAVPQRPSSTGPNIVEYAINAPNVKGQEWYSRSLLSGQGRFQRNCAAYSSADEAQRDFLARGGPDRDRRGIDPDGDGFACGWDPAPFKRAAGN